MKKYFIICLIATSIFTIFSCTKVSNLDNRYAIDEALINEVKTISNMEAQKLAYSKLNAAEKYTIWSNHLKYMSNNLSLNSKQKEIINNVIKPEIWNDALTKQKASESQAFIELEFNIKKEFNKELGIIIFASFSDEETPSVVPPGGGSVNCSCNVGSWFTCNAQYPDCDRMSVCTDGPKDCGFLGLYICDGDCFRVVT